MLMASNPIITARVAFSATLATAPCNLVLIGMTALAIGVGYRYVLARA